MFLRGMKIVFSKNLQYIKLVSLSLSEACQGGIFLLRAIPIKILRGEGVDTQIPYTYGF